MDEYTFVIYKFLVKDKIYIGSTYNFNRRIYEHKYKLNLNYSYALYQYMIECKLTFDNIKIEIIYTSHPLKTKDVLIQRLIEQHFINLYDSVNNGLNTRDAYVSISVYKQRQRKAQYEINRSKMECECGTIHRYNNKIRHLRSAKHKEYVKGILIENKWKTLVSKLIEHN